MFLSVTELLKLRSRLRRTYPETMLPWWSQAAWCSRYRKTAVSGLERVSARAQAVAVVVALPPLSPLLVKEGLGEVAERAMVTVLAQKRYILRPHSPWRHCGFSRNTGCRLPHHRA